MAAQDPGAEADALWLFGYGSLIWKPPPHFDRRIPGWVTGYVRRFWQASEDHRGTPESPGRVVTLIPHAYWSQLRDPHPAPPDTRVWGVAYRIPPARVAEVKEYLDIREINGYTIHYTPFHPAPDVDPALLPPTETATAAPPSSSSSAQSNPSQEQTTTATTTTTTTTTTIKTLVYIGTPDNAQFVGPQDPQQLAEHIYRSAGPSGLNRDYLWGLEAALDELSPESGDGHVTDLSNRVRAIAAREREKGREGGPETTAAARAADQEEEPAGPEQVLQREQQHHQQHHEFRRAGSVDEQEETERAP